MNNEEIIKELSNEIVKRLENEYGFSDIKGNIEGFINQNLDEIKKLQVLQLMTNSRFIKLAIYLSMKLVARV